MSLGSPGVGLAAKSSFAGVIGPEATAAMSLSGSDCCVGFIGAVESLVLSWSVALGDVGAWDVLIVVWCVGI